MNRKTLALAIALATLATTLATPAQAETPTLTTASSGLDFGGYLQISAPLVLAKGDGGDVTLVGGHVALFWAPSRYVHLGVHGGLLEGSTEGGDVSIKTAGLSFKLGLPIGARVWVGAAVDVGICFLTVPALGDLIGVTVTPQVELDVLLARAGAFKIAAFGAIGAQITPYAGGEAFRSHVEISARGATARVGLSLGF